MQRLSPFSFVPYVLNVSFQSYVQATPGDGSPDMTGGTQAHASIEKNQTTVTEHDPWD